MGTSLSGLTPATTFDGLLKVGDNDPLTADLKAISTGDGTDTILSLSNTALSIGGSVTATEVFSGTTGFSFLRTQNNARAVLRTFQADGAAAFYNAVKIGDSLSPTAQLQIVGSGATSATTSLLVQNSAGTDLFKVQDNGQSQFYGIVNFRDDQQLMMQVNPSAGIIDFNPQNLTYDTRFRGDTTSNLIYVDASADKVGMNTNTPSAQLHIKGSGNDDTTTSLLVQDSAGTNLLQANDDGVVLIGPENTHKNYPLELKGGGSNAEMLLRLQSSFNGEGGYLGIGFTNSTNGSGLSSSIRAYRESDHYALSFNFGSNEGTDVLRVKSTGEVGIGETTPTARLHVKAAATQDTIARFQDPLQTWSYIDIKNDSVLTDYTGIFWGSRAKIRSKEVGPVFIDCTGGVSFLDGNSTKSNINSQGAIAIGASAAPASTMAYVKGSGNSNTTTALLVENSDGTDLLKVEDGGVVSASTFYSTVSRLSYINTITNSYTVMQSHLADGSASFYNSLAVGQSTAPSARLQVKGSGNDNTTTALLVQNSDGANLFKVDDSGIGVLVNDDQAGFIRLSASGEYGNIGGGRILRITSGGANPLMISGSGSNGVVIGSTSATTLAANTALAVKGQGATSATNALLVENSAGTEAFKVRDDGNIYLSYSTDAQVLFPKYAMDKTRLHPLTGQNLGVDTNTNFQFGSAFFNDKIHITDNVASNTTADASAKLQVDSTTQGFLPPRMTDSERDAITTPAPGLMVYDTSNNQMNYWNGTTWIAF